MGDDAKGGHPSESETGLLVRGYIGIVGYILGLYWEGLGFVV